MSDPSRKTQERGRARRTALVEASRRLLQAREIEEISLTDVADEAGIPKSSAYHFFGHITEVYEGAASAMEAELHEHMAALDIDGCRDWRQVVTCFVSHGAVFFNGNRDAMQLLIGPRTPSAIKLKDRQADFAIAELLRDRIARRFQLPELADTPELFFRAIEIADLFFGLSVIRHGRITEEFNSEAGRATCAYLSIYLPAVLSAREGVATGLK